MKRFLNAGFAVILAALVATPAFAGTDQNPSGHTGTEASTSGQQTQSAFPGVIPEDRVGSTSNFRSPNMTILGGDQNVNSFNGGITQWSNIPSLILRPAGKRPTDALDTTILWTTPSAARAITIPDAGADSNFILSKGTQSMAGPLTLTGANIITHANAGDLLQNPAGTFTVQLTPSAEVANRILTIPLLGAADTLATLGLGNAFTGACTFSLANGIGLKGTSFNDTIIAKSTQGQATVLTLHDVGAATGEIYTMAAAQTAAGVLSRADMVTETGVVIDQGILKCKNLAGTTITASAGAGVFGISTTATFGAPSQLALVTEVANNNTKTDWCEFEVTLPPDYVAGSAISVNVTQAITIGGGTLSVKTLTVDAFKVAADGTVGSNLGPAAGTLTNSSTTLNFAITPTGLVAGNKLLIQLQTVLTETASSNVTANLTGINVTTSVKM